ncbi:splicing factor U2AF 35 kDa subunit [Acrasis kona]|uniref:Splicing factor U2AF 35 kDa subunit n=1 Tax=Acrasis kona TaxID=1008807 RepID=A0AAW2YYH2_9EUKA
MADGNTFGAEHLADIYGTEKDKFNCPFYWKIGACRHGDRCTRNHNKPVYSQTLLIPHMYPNPVVQPLMDEQGNLLVYDSKFLQEHFEEFFEDVFEELSKSGEIDELNVCDNVAEHLVGNVYVKYFREEDAQAAMEQLKGRFYAGRILTPEFSPVTDFREARCRQFEQNECLRSGMCNFMHLKKPSHEIGKRCFGRRWDQLLNYHDKKKRDDGGAGRGRGGAFGDRASSPKNRSSDRRRSGSRSPDKRGNNFRNDRRRRSRSRSPRGRRGGYRDSLYDDGFGTVAPVTSHANYEPESKRRRSDHYHDDRYAGSSSYPSSGQDHYKVPSYNDASAQEYDPENAHYQTYPQSDSNRN